MAVPLPEGLRRRYLAAMGITAWEARGAPFPVAAPVADAGDAGAAAAVRADVASELERMREAVAACTRCPLCETRTRTVFGVGDPAARCMVIGEGPGADEDRQGEPFVGRAGRLLDAMLRAMGFARAEVFIANVVKCRPPKNRDPHPGEIAACAPYLRRQIELVAPRVILAMGRVAAQSLLATAAPVGRLRGAVHGYGEPPTAVVVTYHPAYLLRSPHDKAKAWQDLRRALTLLRGVT